MERIYQKTSFNEIPWNFETPPDVLVGLVEDGKVKPCEALDLGCGTGNYSIYLATMGFNITGIDISPTAIRIAQENAKKKGVKCNFFVADALNEMNQVKSTFDFVFDWELLHHIFPEQRRTFVENVYAKLNQGGKYLSVCFNEKDNSFGGSGKYRKTRLDTILYFSSKKEIKNLFRPYFNISELKIIRIRGKPESHLVNYAFLEKRIRYNPLE